MNPRNEWSLALARMTDRQGDRQVSPSGLTDVDDWRSGSVRLRESRCSFRTVRDGRWRLGSKRYVRRVVLGESRVEPIIADQQAALPCEFHLSTTTSLMASRAAASGCRTRCA